MCVVRAGAVTYQFEGAPTDDVDGLEYQGDGKAPAVATKEDNIAAWNKLSTADQQNEENRDAVRTELKGNINVRYKDTLRVEGNSGTQIDWSNSELYFERQGVEEVAFDG